MYRHRSIFGAQDTKSPGSELECDRGLGSCYRAGDTLFTGAFACVGAILGWNGRSGGYVARKLGLESWIVGWRLERRYL